MSETKSFINAALVFDVTSFIKVQINYVNDEAVEPKAHKFIQNILVKLSYLGND